MQVHGLSAKTLASVFAILFLSVAAEKSRLRTSSAASQGLLLTRRARSSSVRASRSRMRRQGFRAPLPPTGPACMWRIMWPLAPIR